MLRRKQGFTLIELLVVIAIIAILAAILFPVFAQAREAARKSTCVSNLKQLNTASQMYMQDYDESPPLQFYDDGGATPQQWYTWLDFIQPYVKNYGLTICPDSPYHNTDPVNASDYFMSYGMLPSAQAVGGGFPYFLTRSSAWFQNYCPANLKYDGVSGYGGYSGKAALNYRAGFWPSKPLAAVARPAEYALIFDSGNWDGWHGIYGQQVGLGYCGGWIGYDYSFFGPQPRHSGGRNACDVNTRATEYGAGMYNINFLDGHVKSMKPGAFLRPNPAIPDTLLYLWPNA